jgi:hypothetical protein
MPEDAIHAQNTTKRLAHETLVQSVAGARHATLPDGSHVMMYAQQEEDVVAGMLRAVRGDR